MLKNALIVDDSRLARLTLKRLLMQYDIQVSEAEGVIDAESWIQNNLMPDLVFMDVMMPELDGFQGLERMRANPETRHVPVIMYSGDISEETRKKARDYGATGYLPKPADANRLDHLLNALNKRIQPTEKVEAVPTPESTPTAPKKPGYGRPSLDAVLSNDESFQFSQDNFAPAHKTFAEPAVTPHAQVEAKEPVVPQVVQVATVPPEIILRLNELENRLNAQISKPTSVISPEIMNHFNRLEDRISSQSNNNAQLELSAELERQRRDVVYLQRQVAKSEQLSKASIGLAAIGLLIALAVVIRSVL